MTVIKLSISNRNLYRRLSIGRKRPRQYHACQRVLWQMMALSAMLRDLSYTTLAHHYAHPFDKMVKKLQIMTSIGSFRYVFLFALGCGWWGVVIELNDGLASKRRQATVQTNGDHINDVYIWFFALTKEASANKKEGYVTVLSIFPLSNQVISLHIPQQMIGNLNQYSYLASVMDHWYLDCFFSSVPFITMTS